MTSIIVSPDLNITFEILNRQVMTLDKFVEPLREKSPNKANAVHKAYANVSHDISIGGYLIHQALFMDYLFLMCAFERNIFYFQNITIYSYVAFVWFY